MWDPSTVDSRMHEALAEFTSGVFMGVQRERVDPFLRASLTLAPVVQRAVLEVTQGFVRAHREGGAGHSEGVTVQQRRVVVDGAHRPAEQVVEEGQKPQHQTGYPHRPEVEGGEKLHVEILVALVGRVVITEISLASDCLRPLPQGSRCQHMHPSHIA